MQGNTHFPPRPVRLSRSIARPVDEHNDHAILASWLVTIALIATALLGLLFPLGPSASSWKPAPLSLSLSESGVVPNRAAKADRLAGIQMTTKDAGSGQAESRPVQGADRRIPLGCEGAFSKLVKSDNFAARCVTSLDTPAKFASADAAQFGAFRL